LFLKPCEAPSTGSKRAAAISLLSLCFAALRLSVKVKVEVKVKVKVEVKVKDEPARLFSRGAPEERSEDGVGTHYSLFTTHYSHLTTHPRYIGALFTIHETSYGQF
jgi:hypothetical protein